MASLIEGGIHVNWRAFLLGPKGIQDWLEMGISPNFLAFKIVLPGTKKELKGLSRKLLGQNFKVKLKI